MAGDRVDREGVREALTAVLRDSVVVLERPLGDLTTYRVGGPAGLFVDVTSVGDLERIARITAESAIPVLVIGRGSNLLVADEGFDGLVLRLGESFATVEIEGPMVIAGAGASLPVVARQTVAAGLTGFEWAVGVPGSIGGAVRMNAGGHGSDMEHSVVAAHVVDLRTGTNERLSHRALGFGYRRSAIRDTQIVVDVELALERGPVEVGQALLADIVRWRRDHQPGGQNAGSVFTNPPGDSAGRLIDAAGCKGLRIGSAEVSSKHANFIQSDPGGRAADVLAVMAAVRARVALRFGVDLVPETHLVGFEELDATIDTDPEEGSQ